MIDYRDWQVPLGPAVPGAEALGRAALVRRRGAARAHPHRRRAGPAARRPGPAPTRASRSSRRTRSRLVCLRLVAGDEATEALLTAVNESGQAYLSHTRVHGRYVLRVAIGGTFTERRHVEALWALLRRLAG